VAHLCPPFHALLLSLTAGEQEQVLAAWVGGVPAGEREQVLAYMRGVPTGEEEQVLAGEEEQVLKIRNPNDMRMGQFN
jgi:hypothetical protein